MGEVVDLQEYRRKRERLKTFGEQTPDSTWFQFVTTPGVTVTNFSATIGNPESRMSNVIAEALAEDCRGSMRFAEMVFKPWPWQKALLPFKPVTPPLKPSG